MFPLLLLQRSLAPSRFLHDLLNTYYVLDLEGFVRCAVPQSPMLCSPLQALDLSFPDFPLLHIWLWVKCVSPFSRHAGEHPSVEPEPEQGNKELIHQLGLGWDWKRPWSVRPPRMKAGEGSFCTHCLQLRRFVLAKIA